MIGTCVPHISCCCVGVKEEYLMKTVWRLLLPSHNWQCSSASGCGSVAGSTLVCTSAYGVPDGPRRVSACKGVPMNRLGGRGGHLVTFDPGPPSPPGHQAQSASLVTRCPPGARSLTRALEIGFFALLLPHGWHLRDGRRGGRAGTARASPNEPSSVSYRSRSVPLSGPPASSWCSLGCS